MLTEFPRLPQDVQRATIHELMADMVVNSQDWSMEVYLHLREIIEAYLLITKLPRLTSVDRETFFAAASMVVFGEAKTRAEREALILQLMREIWDARLVDELKRVLEVGEPQERRSRSR